MILWLFEFGYVLQHLAIVFQILEIKKTKSTEGISYETILFFSIATVCRLVWMWDSMLANFYFAYLELIAAVASLSYIIYLHNQYKVYDYIRQKTPLPAYLKFPVLLITILIMAFFFHPGNKNRYYFTIQMFVSTNIYSECLGLLPQLYLIGKSSETGNVSAYYLVFLAFARFFRLFFWFKMYLDGNSFFCLIFADLVHTIFLCLFIYTYTKNFDSIKLPTFAEENKRTKIF